MDEAKTALESSPLPAVVTGVSGTGWLWPSRRLLAPVGVLHGTLQPLQPRLSHVMWELTAPSVSATHGNILRVAPDISPPESREHSIVLQFSL